ncbi:hypothetical protein Mlab_1680 [Methanocorpusculum labreanum Z]|uniref:SufBD protein n=1 Tax=Methanocorpusculum labreanum (strain ATCC 43576 / DSM 4855 / Z) TaxID=410358 RepID=A2SU35_METLZ|nr:hypothetical protein [Methanocorpusculum labreanum]ABN07841.1 hypothetical protein Mlab_1680 [Methanocorpusculum labreanum Z]
MDAEELEEDVRGLYSPDTKAAYASFLRLKAESEEGDSVYRFWDDFAGMMENENSYVRTRGLLLIAANAKWDTDHKLDGVLPQYLEHILDEKPITARQCISALKSIVSARGDLVPEIRQALETADTGRYNANMRPLIEKDIAGVLKMMEGVRGNPLGKDTN